jgi:hypothetical protein
MRINFKYPEEVYEYINNIKKLEIILDSCTLLCVYLGMS